ncbi:hypothetical protein [Prevotellamassilia timonensis]|uniref:hypothetical protein n=1 Tax=Prevotellamassilia timonensis TaxID=1852370 RepID=UPI0008D908F8|nr:hypothetical protein [Prevotellamassilia timonensis]
MKKISTLALALIAMGSLSMPASAQVTFEPVSTATLESGWYQMRQVVGVSRNDISATAPRYVYSADALGKNYTWFGTDASQKTDATAFVYVHKNGSNYAIMNINGKWGSNMAKYIEGNAEPSYAITQDASNNTQYQVGATWDDWTGWNYMGGASSAQTKAARFEFSKVGETALAAYDVYTVSITGDATTVSVTSTNTANKGTKTVYNGGSYFFTAGTSISESDFTIPDVAGCTKTVAFDASAKTLTVNYTLDESLITKAENVLGKTGIGYPTATSTVRTNLSTALTNAKTSKTLANYSALSSAYTAYLASSDIQMPEDGKAYTFTAIFYDGAKRYMDYAESGYSLVPTSDETNANYPETAKLICRKVGDNKFTFANNAGKHFVWKGGTDGANSNKGYVDTYNAEYAVTVAKIVKGGYVVDKENEDLLGYVGVMGYRKPSGKNPEQDYFIFTVNGSTYSYNQANAPFYKTSGGDKHSSLIKIEETTYPNTVTFNAVSDVEGVSNLATFSAPFATVIPEGVTAYYVSTADNTKATMKAIEAGKAIPAKTGVLLTSESADAVTMVPATDETLATIENNKLGNSAGADKTIAEGDNAYILAKGANGTAFYKGKIGTTLKANKAYLTLDAAGAPEAISMNFGGNVTGINQIVNAEQNNAPVYDLTGRRVVRTVKGGLYIKGGNKFIAR